MVMTIGSLFSGIGGLELGLERAGLGSVACREGLARMRQVWPDGVVSLEWTVETQVMLLASFLSVPRRAACALGACGFRGHLEAATAPPLSVAVAVAVAVAVHVSSLVSWREGEMVHLDTEIVLLLEYAADGPTPETKLDDAIGRIVVERAQVHHVIDCAGGGKWP